eukprot:TRINITY_DN9561_c0_g1_i2.p1 TRINITY_DN9561_c0_g1~~TRINITY_DN9561_c0_g1_i2.p1  ORF type:complete len:327 (-),score=32.91 TRINITY_DN9561_c0_g1_i2:184-1164(-)
MTFSILNVLGVVQVSKGSQPSSSLLLHDYENWSVWKKSIYDYLIGCHLSHILDFSTALVCYYLFFVYTNTFEEAKQWNASWVSKVVVFNLVCEFVVYGFWHWMLYVGQYSKGNMKSRKFNKVNQYGENPTLFSSSTGNLEREILFTTLGWLQSSMYQCVMMWLWKSERVPFYSNFWSLPFRSVFFLLFVTYWREFHFYWVHRLIHPWFNIKYGLLQGDIGSFLYRHVHSLHHKSYNPGPLSGLSMHPFEHFLYYTCTLLPLFIYSHPLHFLYAKFHADIAPIGGNDGFKKPGGDSEFHWLHHSKFECNYGVPLINFDKLFGTFVEY